MKITVDPTTELSGFGYVEAGKYRLRVVSCTQQAGKKFPYIKWEFEFVDPNVKSTDEKSKPGHIFENTTLKPGDSAQFRLRQTVEALGLEWADFDTDEVIGMECDAQVGVHNYDGKLSNEVTRFIPAA